MAAVVAVVLLALPWGAGAQTEAPAGPSSSPPFWTRPRTGPTECPEPPPLPVVSIGGSPARGFTPMAISIGMAGFLAGLLMLPLLRRNVPLARARPGAIPRAPPAPATRGETARSQELLSAVPAPQVELEEPLPQAGTEEARRFFEEAAAALATALRKSPRRQDLRHKLLEMLFFAGMRDQFLNEAHTFLQQNRGRLDEAWAEIVRMGHELLPEHTLFRQPDGEAIRRTVHFRRFYDRKLDQAALHVAQHELAAAVEPLLAESSFIAEVRAGGLSSRPAPELAPAPLDVAGDPTPIFVARNPRRPQDDVTLNAFGQVLLARMLGRKSVVAATRDGTHGLATATAAVRLGMQCVVYLSEADLAAHYARVLTLRKLGAMVRPVRIEGGAQFTDPRQHALQAWIQHPQQTMFVSSLTGGPSPYPLIVGQLQAMVWQETVERFRRAGDSAATAAVVTATADGYGGIGLLRAFLDTPATLHCLEDAAPDAEAAAGRPRLRREHAWLHGTGRVTYTAGDDAEAMRVIERFHRAGSSLGAAAARNLAHACRLGREHGACVLALVSAAGEAETVSAYSDL